MLEQNLARLQAHRSNIRRYRRLLKTKLTDLERDFISRRLEEEEQALQALSAMAFTMAAPQRPLYGGSAGHV